MTDAPAPLVRGPDGRFLPGNPGRRFGSRNRLSQRVADAILRDFEAHQHELLPRLRRWFLPRYVQLVARLLPRPPEADGAGLEALDGAEAADLVAALRAALDRIEAGGGSLIELEAALLGAEPPDCAPLADEIG